MALGYLIKKDEILLKLGEITTAPDAYLAPLGRDCNNEMTDIITEKDAEVGYHEHEEGFETFFMTKGSVEAVIRGKKVILLPGDILHLPAYVPHRFRWLEEGTIWREIFHRMEMHRGLRTRKALETYFPDKGADPEYMKKVRRAAGTVGMTEPEAVEVPKSEVPEVRQADFAFSEFSLFGMVFRQKVGRWETAGVKEIWEVIFEKGVKLEAKEEPDYNIGIFSISTGSFRFQVGHEEFVAEAGDLVYVPEYVSFSLEALEEGSTLIDMNCQAYLLRLLETLKALSIRESEKLKDRAFVKELLLENHCYITEHSRV